MDPALWELYEEGAPEDEIPVILRVAEGAKPPPQVHVVADFGEIMTGRIRREDVPTVWHDESIVSLKAPRKVWAPLPPEPESDSVELGELDGTDEAVIVPNPALELGQDGRGVVVGFCDWGFDFTHPNFRNDDGSTRLLALWDQNQDRVFSRDQVNAALRTSDPCATLGYHFSRSDRTDSGLHGTHVADIAVGNRREPGSVAGLAPRADIVFVHLGREKFTELENLGDSVDMLEGLDFVWRTAAGRPCVASLSAGSVAGPHCGASTVERAVDRMLSDGKLVLIQSVGNYASMSTHSHARIGPSQTHSLDWLIPPHDRTPNEVELWYSGRDIFRVTLTEPGGRTFEAPLDSRLRIEFDGLHLGNFYHRKHEPNSGLNHVDIVLRPSAPSGRWRITLQGERVVDGRVHAWIERDGGGRNQSRFPSDQATSLFTTNTICNSFHAIAVGAHDAAHPDRPPTPFSSRGPTLDGRLKPEVSAPGKFILAARSMPRDGWNGQRKLCVKSGTSMAAPYVAGTVALMMGAAGRQLSIHETRSILIGTADPGGGPSGRGSTRIGYGYVNVRGAVEAARNLRTVSLALPSGPRVSLPANASDDESELDVLPSAESVERLRRSA